jgi:hypothetical protein
MRSRSSIQTLVFLAVVVGGCTMSREDNASVTVDLTQYQWRHRLLLLFAPSEDDDAYAKVRNDLVRQSAGVEERDLVVFRVLEHGESYAGGDEIDGRDAASLRERFTALSGEFLLVLVGKDGTVKRRSEGPVAIRDIFEQIDAMPMRRREMRERQPGR